MTCPWRYLQPAWVGQRGLIFIGGESKSLSFQFSMEGSKQCPRAEEEEALLLPRALVSPISAKGKVGDLAVTRKQRCRQSKQTAAHPRPAAPLHRTQSECLRSRQHRSRQPASTCHSLSDAAVRSRRGERTARRSGPHLQKPPCSWQAGFQLLAWRRPALAQCLPANSTPMAPLGSRSSAGKQALGRTPEKLAQLQTGCPGPKKRHLGGSS